jgi:long-chain acyl-CoA synthetase
METPQRLFDCLEYNLAHNPLEDMLAGKVNGEWIKYSTAVVKKTVDEVSAAFIAEGIGSGDGTAEGRDKIAVICRNRPEWVMLDLAVQQTGAVLVPIYPTISINELEFILQDSKARILFLDDASIYQRVKEIQHRLPDLRQVYSFEKLDGVDHWSALQAKATDASPAAVKERTAAIKYEDLATIIYTSGTTGVPKGVMLSHKNILSNVFASIPCFPPYENLRALSFLPLNHIFERMVTYVYLYKGTSIYYAESMETIADNLREVKPHLFTTVPRLLEKVYEKIMSKGAALTGIKKQLFFWAHRVASKFEINTNQGILYNAQLALANKLIFSKWREALGGNIVCIVSGGAACQVRLIRIFTAAKLRIMEGYGLTETSPVISVNRFQEEGRMFGTVGPLIEGVEVRIAEDGEILCKGPNIMTGYYKKPELTTEVIEDGWFKTGDIGQMVAGKFLKITDRKKEMFKTSGGKYVAPLVIENKLKESRFIENIIVLGAGMKFVSALIVPSFANLKDWCRDNGVEVIDNNQLVTEPKVRQHYRELIDSYNRFFNHVEQVKKFELLPLEWAVETGELTPKLSLKRKVVTEKYNSYIEKIYVADAGNIL